MMYFKQSYGLPRSLVRIDSRYGYVKALSEPSFASAAHAYFLGNGARNSGQPTTFIENLKLPVHRWYRYSAGYSAEWASSLLRHWGSLRVLDPFAGSGTTCLAAQEQRVESIGVEIHPMVARIARAKLNWPESADELREQGKGVIAAASRDRTVNVPDAPLVGKCFPHQQSLHDLLKIRDAVFEQNSEGGISELLWLAFVSIIRACSPAGTAQWQYVLPNKTKSRVAEPFAAFQATVEMFAQDMEVRDFLVGANPVSAKMLESDARRLDPVPDGWADTIITSPPYANNYDYADALRLEQIILGDIDGWKDLKPLREVLVRSATQNVGGWDAAEALESSYLKPIIKELLPVYETLNEVRKTRAGNKAYHTMIAGYMYDNAQVFESLRRVSASGVKVCYVVGDSAPYGIHVPVEKWLGELALSAGFKSWSFSKVRDRNTKWKNRKHRHPLHEGYLWIEG